MPWFFWALATALAWALVNIVDQILLVRFVKSVNLAVKILAFFSLLIVGIGWVLSGNYLLEASPNLIRWALVAGILEIFYIYYYLKAIEKEEVSFIITIFSFAPLAVALLAWLFWGELISRWGLLGMFLTVAGVIALIWARYGMIYWRRNRALGQIALATVFFALSSLALDRGVGDGSWSAVFIWSRLGVVVGVLVITIFSRSWSDFKQLSRPTPYIFFISEALYGVSVFCSIKALDNGVASYVVSVENIQPIFVFSASYLLYRFYPRLIPERTYFVKPILALLSIILIVFGVSLIQF